MEEIVYKVHIITSGIKFELKVNDVTIAREDEGYGFSSQFSINEWLFNGANLVQVIMKPRDGIFETSSQAKLRVGLSDPKKLVFQEIFQEEIIDLKDNPKTLINYSLVVEDLPVTLPLPSLPIIPIEKEEIVSRLYSKIKELYDLFEKKKLKEITTLCEFRMGEYDKVYYRPYSTAKSNFEKLIEDVTKDEILLKFIEEKLNLNLHAGGKLVSFDYNEYYLPAIMFSPPDYSNTRSFTFYWALDDNNEPYIYR